MLFGDEREKVTSLVQWCGGGEPLTMAWIRRWRYMLAVARVASRPRATIAGGAEQREPAALGAALPGGDQRAIAGRLTWLREAAVAWLGE
jgi:hypothetical protein